MIKFLYKIPYFQALTSFFISVLLFQKSLSLLLSFEAEKPKRKSNSTLVDLSDQLLFGSCLKDSNRRILWDRAFWHKTRKRHFVSKFAAFSSFFSLKNQLATLLINRKHYPPVLNELLGVEWRASDLWAMVFWVELHLGPVNSLCNSHYFSVFHPFHV